MTAVRQPSAKYLELRERAAAAGMTLSDYLSAEFSGAHDARSLEEVIRDIRSREPLDPSIDIAAIIREARDERS